MSKQDIYNAPPTAEEIALAKQQLAAELGEKPPTAEELALAESQLKDGTEEGGVLDYLTQTAKGIGIGAAQGLPLVGSFIDEGTAAVKAALASQGSDKSFSEEYEDKLSEVRADLAKIREDAPVASLAAELGINLVPAFGMGKLLQGASIAGKLGRGAAAGAITGAAHGFGASEADTLKGRLEDAATPAAVGFGVGGAMPGLISTASAGKNFLANTLENMEAGRYLKTAWNRGFKEGKGIGGIKEADEIRDKVIEEASGLMTMLKSNMSKIKSAQIKTLKENSDLELSFEPALNKFKTESTEHMRDDIAPVLDKIKELTETTSNSPEEFLGVRSKLSNLYEGYIAKNEFSKAKMVEAFKSGISDELHTKVPGLAEIDKQKSGLLSAFKYTGTPERARVFSPGEEKDFSTDKLIDLLGDIGKGGLATKEKAKFNALLASVKAYSPEFAEEFVAKMNKAAREEGLQNTLAKTVLTDAGPVRQAAGGGLNLFLRGAGETGAVLRKGVDIAKTPLTSTTKGVLGMFGDDAASSKLAQKLLSSTSEVEQGFGRVLQTALTAPQQKRTALMFALSQNPEFRKYLTESE